MKTTRALIGLASAGLLMASAGPASAAGQYDGNWVVDFPSTGYSSSTGQYSCPGFRLPIQISNNQISGQLARSSTGRGVTSGSGSSSQPVTGQVQPDGSFDMAWKNYSANGKLSQTQGRATIARGGCAGQRQGTMVRLAQ
jgi:hypothetical protein